MADLLLENLHAIGQISISVVTAIIAYLVYRSTKTIGKLAQTRFIIEQIQNINMALLNDQELFNAIATSKSRPGDKEADISEYKKRRMIIMQLQIGSAIHSGYKNGYMDKDQFDEYMHNMMHRWIVDHRDYTLSVVENWTSDYGRYIEDKIRESMS